MILKRNATRGATKWVAILAITALAGCGFSGGGFSKGGFSKGGSGFSRGGIFSKGGSKSASGNPDETVVAAPNTPLQSRARKDGVLKNRSTITDLFRKQDNPNATVAVNKYIWNAALDVLSFLPITAADPFSGVIVTGYGTPPGGGRAYRATIYVQDPALDARSLNLALATRSGPARADTVRAIEDAILTRARQLRIRDSKL